MTEFQAIIPAFLQDTNLGIWLLVGIALTTLIKVWPVMQKQKDDADGSLRNDLLKRIETLEKELLEERRHCAEQLAELRGKFDGLMRQFIQAQMAWAQAIPPSKTTPAIANMLENLAVLLEEPENEEPANE